MKHTMLKCLSLVLALVTIVSVCALPALAADPECTHSDKSKWKLIEKHEQTYCNEWGYTVYECEKCNKHFAEDFITPKGKCDWEVAEEKAATCTEAGSLALSCKKCGQTITVKGPKTAAAMEAEYGIKKEIKGALDHDWKSTTVKTCTGEWVETFECTRCGATKTGETVAAPGHNYKPQYDTLKAPTCSTTGSMVYKCDVKGCGAEVTVMIEAYGHLYTVEVTAKAPTCKEDGYGNAADIVAGTKFHICKDCGKVQEGDDKLVPALGHPNDQCTKLEEEGSYKAATCTEDGYQMYHCELCDEDVKVIIKAAHTKDPSTVKVTPATCETDAVETYTCVVCGKTDCTEVIENSSLQHHYNTRDGATSIIERFTAPTCTEYGFYWHGCTQCGLVLAPEDGKVTKGGVTYDVALDGKINPTGHQTAIEYVKDHTVDGVADEELSGKLKAATCTLGEHYWVECSCTEANWNAAAKAAVEAAWNALSEEEKTEAGDEATWKDTKTTEWKAANPVENYYVAIEKEGGAPATGHPESKRTYTEAKAPTCTEDGWTRYFSCSECGKEEIGKVAIPALGHAWSTRKVAANCDKAAHEETYCTRCDIEPTDIVGSETGEKDPNNHVYEVYQETKPTCTGKGVRSWRCKHHVTAIYNEEIPATGHSFNAPGFDLDAAIADGTATPVYPTCDKKDTPGYYVVACENDGCTETAHKGSIPFDVNNIYHHGFVDQANPGTTVKPSLEADGVTVVHIEKDCSKGQRGYDQYVCDKEAGGCGALLALYTDDGLHNFEKNDDSTDKIYAAVAATCISAGHTEYKVCLDCRDAGRDDGEGKVGYEEIAALGHNIVELAAKDSTCKEKGNTAGYTCLNCGDKDETDPSHADLLEKLETDRKNLVVYLPLAPHTWNTPAKAATCQAPGNTEGGTCTVCGATQAIEVIEQLAHDYGTAVYDKRTANCTLFGYNTYRCTMCKEDMYTVDYVAATGHKLKETVHAPTCVEGGYTEVVCENTGCDQKGFDQKKDVKDALGHLMADGKTTFSAQCDLLKEIPEEDRYCYREGCPNCITTEEGDEKTAKQIQPVHLGLDQPGRTQKTVPATCIQYAYTIDACDRCQMYKVTELSDEGYGDHNFVACTSAANGEFLAPTLTSDGWRVYKCSTCKVAYAADKDMTKSTTDKTQAWKETLKACDIFFSMSATNGLVENVHVVNSGKIALTIKMSASSYDLYSILMEVKYNGQYLKFAGIEGVKDVFGTDDVVAHSENGYGANEIVKIYAYAENTTAGEQKNVTLKGEQTFVTLYFDVRTDAIPDSEETKFLTTGFDFGEVQVVSVNDGAYTTVKASHDATEKSAPVKLSTVAYGDYNGYNFKKIETKVDIYRLGDITTDGRVTDVDAAALKAIILGALNSGKYVAEADINKDGEIDAKDFVWLQRLLVGRVDYEEFCNASAN